MVQDISQDDDLHIEESNEQDRSFVAVRVKYINLDSVKSVIFTKLESSTNIRNPYSIESRHRN